MNRWTMWCRKTGDFRVDCECNEVGFYRVPLVEAVGSVVYRRHTFSDTNLQKTMKAEANPRRLATNSQTGEVASEQLRRIEALRGNYLESVDVPENRISSGTCTTVRRLDSY